MWGDSILKSSRWLKHSGEASQKTVGSDYQYTNDQYLNIYKVKVFCKKAMGSADPIAYTLLPHCSNNYMRPLPIRVMTDDHFEYGTWEKREDKLTIKPLLGGVTKFQANLHSRRKPGEKEKRKNRMKKLNQTSSIAYKVVKTKYASLCPSSYGSTIFDEIAQLSSSCASILLLASKILLYLDV
jgi:hypothetical protein